MLHNVFKLEGARKVMAHMKTTKREVPYATGVQGSETLGF